jgi:hypothetical protein
VERVEIKSWLLRHVRWEWVLQGLKSEVNHRLGDSEVERDPRKILRDRVWLWNSMAKVDLWIWLGEMRFHQR